MGRILSIVLGIAAVAFGIVLIIRWWPLIVKGLQFCAVGALLFGGLMAVIFGIIEIKDAIELKKLEQEQKKE